MQKRSLRTFIAYKSLSFQESDGKINATSYLCLAQKNAYFPKCRIIPLVRLENSLSSLWAPSGTLNLSVLTTMCSLLREIQYTANMWPRGLCVWVCMLDILWSWTLNSAKTIIEAALRTSLRGLSNAQVHRLSWSLPSSPLPLIDMENNFLRRTKMAPTASWRLWIKTAFDDHIVWMLAGSFTLDLPPNKRGWHSSYTPICWFLPFRPSSFIANSCCDGAHVAKCASVVGGCLEFSRQS